MVFVIPLETVVLGAGEEGISLSIAIRGGVFVGDVLPRDTVDVLVGCFRVGLFAEVDLQQHDGEPHCAKYKVEILIRN